MFKSQTLGRRLYSAIGGRVGLIFIIVIVIILTITIIIYFRRKIIEQRRMNDDFYRYNKLIDEYCLALRQQSNFTEEDVKLYMDQYQFNQTMIPLGASEGREWFKDTEIFGDLCNILRNMMTYASDPDSKYYKNKDLWKIILSSFRFFNPNVPNYVTDYQVPFGTNWYQFSITYPIYLVATAFSYLKVFGREDPFLVRHLSSYINNYFKDPPRPDQGMISIGWLRDGSNVAGMSVPLIGGRLYSRRFTPNTTSQQYIRNFFAAEYSYSGNGMYYDNSFIFHESRNDGYTTSFYNEFLLVYNFYRLNTRFFKILHHNFSILEHPTIPYHHCPWFTRTGSCKGFQPVRKFARYGLDIRGYERGVCVRTKEISLFYNGQNPGLACYESDRVNKEWGQCWVFMRHALTKEHPGRLYPTLVPYYGGVHSYGLKQIDWASQLQTTNTYNATNVTCSLCCFQDRAAGMYQKFSITMDSIYKFDVEEINIATPTGFHVYYHCQPDMVLASSNPYTIACHLGKLDPVQENRLKGIASKHAYAFDNFIGTFIYLDEIDDQEDTNVIKTGTIKNPGSGDMLDTLVIQPYIRQTIKAGFSNNYYTPGTKTLYNNMLELPTIWKLEIEGFTLERLETENALLLLHDNVKKECMISYAFGAVLPKQIEIKKSLLDERFESYKVTDGIYMAGREAYVVNTFEKQFQMHIKDIKYRS